MNSESLEVLACRWFKAPVELAFRAFTEAPLLEQWFCPSPEVALRVEHCDPRPGGAYRFVFHFPDGRVVPVIGEYRTVEAPRKLVFTWTWEEPDPWAGVVTLVTVKFSARNGGTNVEVHHERFTSPDVKQVHDSGWIATLRRLEHMLAEISERELVDESSL
jgi:uncharacterized protein YndB with AHSA1/START domain